MRAKEYAKLYNESNDKVRTAIQIRQLLMGEAWELVKIRNAQKDSAIISILDEQNRKWNAIVKRTDGGLRLDGFLNSIDNPILKIALKKYSV